MFLRILVLALVLGFGFSGCSSYFENKFQLGAFEEKRIQTTKKGEITKDNKISLVVLVTYLNNLNYRFYNNMRYFFVEFYSPSSEPINLKRFRFELDVIQGFSKKLQQNQNWDAIIARNLQSMRSTTIHIEPLYVHFIAPQDYDILFHPINKWSQCYLVAFPRYKLNDDNVKFRIYVDEVPLLFDFSFNILPFKIL